MDRAKLERIREQFPRLEMKEFGTGRVKTVGISPSGAGCPCALLDMVGLEVESNEPAIDRITLAGMPIGIMYPLFEEDPEMAVLVSAVREHARAEGGVSRSWATVLRLSNAETAAIMRDYAGIDPACSIPEAIDKMMLVLLKFFLTMVRQARI